MSFMLTTEQIRNRTKTVTRRRGWWFLVVNEKLNAVEKGQGLKKGEKIQRINLIKTVSARPETINTMSIDPVYGKKECKLEGFPNMEPDEFVEMFCDMNKCLPKRIINRIEFEYI